MITEYLTKGVTGAIPKGAINLTDDKKTDVLIALMISSKTNILSWHDRSFKATSWSIGILLSIIGYFVLHGNSIPLGSRIILVIGVLLFGAMTQIFLLSATKASHGSRFVLTKCESALRLSETNTYFKDKVFFDYHEIFEKPKLFNSLQTLHLFVLLFSITIILFADPAQQPIK